MTRDVRLTAAILAFLLLTGAGSCAYYNTFYHARQYYAQAEKSRTAAAEDRRSTVGLDMYEKSMQKCAKVILEYPDSRWVDDAILLMGKRFYAKGDYLAALRKFDEILLYYEKSNLRRQARFGKARTLVALEQFDDAVPVLQEFREGKKDDLRAEALYLLALVEFERENYAGAAEGFELYLAQGKGTRSRDEVLAQLGESYRNLNESAKAERVLRDRLENPLLAGQERLQAVLDLSDALVDQGRFDEAFRVLDEIRSETGSVNDSIRIEYYEGKAMIAEGRLEEGVEFLRSALEGAPSNDAAGKIAYLLGEIYLEEYDNKDSAAAAYRKAVSYPGEEDLKEEAGRKSKFLGDYLQLKVDYAAGGADTARVHFLLAENDLFFFEQPDSALLRYRHVSDGFPGSRFAPRALAARAYILERMEGREAEKDSLLRLMVRKYPKSPAATEVLDRGDVTAPPESLEAWVVLWEEAHPETTDSVAVIAEAAGEPGDEGGLLPAGSEGSLSGEGEEGVFTLMGPPGPLEAWRTADPAYPILEGEDRPKGKVKVEVEVNREGRVEDARIIRSSARAFEGPALAAAYQHRYYSENVKGTRTAILEFEIRPSP
ncbi:MAG: TonB family protein [Candidatus Eisenbacteria bacterium]